MVLLVLSYDLGVPGAPYSANGLIFSVCVEGSFMDH